MKKILSALALAACATLASAGALTLTGFEQAGTATVHIVQPNSDFVYAGGMNATFSAGAPSAFDPTFVVYCIELDAHAPAFNHATTYTMNTPAVSANGNLSFSFDQELRLEKLFDRNGGASTTSAVQSAAMQLAIWEILYETGPTFGNVNTGTFKLDNRSDEAVVRAAANTLLANLDSEVLDFTWDLTSFNNGHSVATQTCTGNGEHKHCTTTDVWDAGYQDFVTAAGTPITFGGCFQDPAGCADIPEPGSLALAGMGLLGAGIVQRRRKLAVVTE